MRERATPAKTGTPIEGMIIGANSNTYLRRGATFDVMKNVEAGVEDTGEGLGRREGLCCTYTVESGDMHKDACAACLCLCCLKWGCMSCA
jgi:hypothetical protein